MGITPRVYCINLNTQKALLLFSHKFNASINHLVGMETLQLQLKQNKDLAFSFLCVYCNLLFFPSNSGEIISLALFILNIIDFIETIDFLQYTVITRK